MLQRSVCVVLAFLAGQGWGGEPGDSRRPGFIL